jgi:hypothetical protein
MLANSRQKPSNKREYEANNLWRQQSTTDSPWRVAIMNIAKAIFVAGLLCFVPYFYVTRVHKPIESGAEDQLLLGLPQSPWFHHSSTETRVETKANGSHSFSMNSSYQTHVDFLSWSMLLAIVGVVLIVVSRRLRSNPV